MATFAIQTIGAKIVATLVGFTLTGALKDRISSNDSRGRLFLFSHKKGAIIRGKAIISNIPHWNSCLNIFFYYAIKSKNNHIKLTEHGLFKCSKFY